MLNIDTLLLVSGSQAVRRRFRVMLEADYHILECARFTVARLMMEQNSARIATILIDCTDIREGDREGMKMLCDYSREQSIPTVAILNAYHGEDALFALEAGIDECVAETGNEQVVGLRLHNIITLRREMSRLSQQIKKQNDMILQANETFADTLASLVEYRSADSGLHILRTRRFTKVLLEEVQRTYPEYGLDERAIAEITSASALHDVGKIAIPDSILNKPGALLAYEYEVIKTHSLIGARILEKMSETFDSNYLNYACDICRYHHERWDGQGYPSGLMEDEIPIYAQVVGLVDAYDALTNRRVYKDAFELETAAQMIINGECGQFSPKVLGCFKVVLEDFFELSRIYADDRMVREDKVVNLALPSPMRQADINSLYKTQSKYSMLLNYLNATVIELDMRSEHYHVVYNPRATLAVLNTGATLRESIRNLLSQYAHPEEREAVEASIFDHINRQCSEGLKRQTFDVVFGGDSLKLKRYKVTLMSMNPEEEDDRVMLMIWNKVDENARSALPAEMSDRQALAQLTNFCKLRSDSWLTIEDSDAIAGLLGYTPEAFSARFHNRLLSAVIAQDREEALSQIQTQMEQNSEIELILRLQHCSGSMVPVLLKGMTCMDENGIEHIACILIRLGNAYAQQERSCRGFERYEMILDQYEHAVFEWDMAADRLVYAKNLENIFGPEVENTSVCEMLRSSPRIHRDDVKKIDELLACGLMGKRTIELDIRVMDGAGRYKWQRINAAIELDEEQKPKRCAGIIHNIDREKRDEQMLREKTEADVLTQLLNKEAARRQVESHLMKHRGRENFAMLLLDLDNFKSVNDHYGHLFGDAVLCDAGRVIRRHFRPDDVVARIGGDEFMVMMRPNVTRELIHGRCQALCRALKEQLARLVREGSVSVSIGVAFAPEHANNYAELFQRADQALYMSKKRGKDTYSLFDPEDAAYMQLTVPEAFSTRIDSDEAPGLADNSIVRYAFKRLYEAKNEEEAINSILAVIGEQMNVDRVYIFENSADNQYCSNTFEWCNAGIEPQIDRLQNIHYERDISGFLEAFNEQGIFYCPDTEMLEEPVYSVVKAQGIKSLLACAIREKGVVRGYVGFDECTQERVWTKEQIDALIFFSEMLSVFLIKMRIQRKTNLYADNLVSILNSRPECIYVVDAENFEIRFVNTSARQFFAGLDVGKQCHDVIHGRSMRCSNCPARNAKVGETASEEIICSRCGWKMHVEATLISWQDENAYLITCPKREKITCGDHGGREAER